MINVLEQGTSRNMGFFVSVLRLNFDLQFSNVKRRPILGLEGKPIFQGSDLASVDENGHPGSLQYLPR